MTGGVDRPGREGRSLRLGRLAVIGVGLIGGSLARALRAAGCVERITGIGRSAENLRTAERLGIIDDWSHDVAAVEGADTIVVAVPMGAYDQVFSALELHARSDAVITDVGSTKQHALDTAARYLTAPGRFVAGHPIAGTEDSGAAASFVGLFRGATVVLTPGAAVEQEAVRRVEAMWRVVGASPCFMDAAEHDRLMAAVSHLPHLAAFAIVNAVTAEGRAPEMLRFAAGGFRDFTRIASSSPTMWRDIALTNREALVAQIDALQAQLTGMRQAVVEGDGARLAALFQCAKRVRDDWLHRSDS